MRKLWRNVIEGYKYETTDANGTRFQILAKADRESKLKRVELIIKSGVKKRSRNKISRHR